MKRKAELLLASCDEHTRALSIQVARSLDCAVLTAKNRKSAQSVVERGEIGVVLLDAATILEYLDLTRAIKRQSARIEVLIADQQPSIPAAVEAIKAGAADYLEKPLTKPRLEMALSQALEMSRNFRASVLPLEELEKQAIKKALAQVNGDKVEAARLLSIGKTTLYRKLKEYGEGSEANVSQSGTDDPRA